MKTRLYSLVIVVMLILSASLATAQERTRYPLTVVDDAGATVVLPARPQRIVSLTLSTDEILLSLVDRPRLLGVTTFAVDPAVSSVAVDAASVPNKLTLNVEVVVSLHPDLVFVASWSDPAPVAQLRAAGVPVYLMTNGLSVMEIEQKITRIALLTDDGARARSLIDGMQGRIAAVAARVAGIAADKRPRVIDYTSFGASMGKGSSWDDIVRQAGLVNAVGDIAPDEWGQVSISQEKLLVLDPDIIVVPGWTYGDPQGAKAFLAQVLGDPSLKGLAALKAHRVYMMPENLRESTSQYIVDAVAWMAKTAYPVLFP